MVSKSKKPGFKGVVFFPERESLQRGVRLLHVPITQLVKDGEGKEHLTFRTVTLLPGANFVDAADWEVCKKFSQIARRLEAGVIVESSVASDKNSPAGLPEVEASVIVENTYDARLLKVWEKDDGRSSVEKAIASRSKVLENGDAK